MPDSITPKDMKVLSDAIIDGSMKVDNLPSNAQVALQNYWTSLGVNSGGDIDSATSQAQVNALVQQRQQEAGGTSIFDTPVFKPIEWAGSKLYWLYSHTVSPAVSGALIKLHAGIYGGADGVSGSSGISDMGTLWNQAKATSPGQALWMLGLSNDELKKRGINPAKMAQDKQSVNNGTYKDTPTKTDPFGDTPAYQEYFGHGASKYVTGAADLAVSWYADPTVLAGKAAGITKTLAFTKPVTPALERAGGDFDKLVGGSTYQSMVNTVMNVKKATPDSAALILRDRFPTIKQSANGDVLASLLSQAKDADEVSDILRVSMGDNGGRLALQARNSLLSSQIDVATARLAPVNSYYGGMSDTVKQSAWGVRTKAYLDQQTKMIQQMDHDYRIVQDKIGVFNTVGNMNYNRVTTPLGLNVRNSEAVQGNALKSVRGAGVVKGATSVIYNAAIGLPIKLAHSYNDIKPTAYIDVHAEDSYRNLDSSLRDSGIPRDVREAHVSKYISATPAERQQVLMNTERSIVGDMVDNFNANRPADQHITKELANDLYKDFANRRSSGQADAANGRSYSNATMPDPNNPGMQIRVATIDTDGGRVIPTPILDTQIANSHVLMDFRTMKRAIDSHGTEWQKLRNLSAKAGDAGAWTLKAADHLSSIWKFGQLFRLGYAPRALADDFLGQVARDGSMAMMGRAMTGGKVATQDFFRARWASDSVDAARTEKGVLEQHMEELAGQQASTSAALDRARAGAGGDVKALESDMDDISTEIEKSKQQHYSLSQLVAQGAQSRDIKIGRQIFSAPFGGEEGSLFKDLAAGDRNFSNMMGSGADWYLKRVRRLDWEDVTPESRGAEFHMEAWKRIIERQIGQSAVGRQALMGKNENEMATWMRSTPEGIKYRREINLANMSDVDLARQVKAHVDDVLNPNINGMDIIRQQALTGEVDEELLKQIPQSMRPRVNAEAWRYAEGTSPVTQLMDKAISGFYKMANQVPAEKLLRNPLFGQEYKAYLSDAMDKLQAQGVTHLDESTRQVLESNARKVALQNVKKYTFTMDHETKMAFQLRHFGAFFGAQQESWNRWARIISDKPDVLAHVSMAYGAPARAGIVTDSNGNPVDGYGYVTDPVTGKKRLTSMGERTMVVQIPSYLGGKKLNKMLGLDPDASFTIPMSSADIILNKGDGALPVGAGPFVQIAVNHFAQQDPKVADWAQKLGVLPFGPQKSILDFINPTTGKRLGDSNDDMGATKQRALFYMMQVENYKYQNKLRKTAPTWGELENRADRWTMFRTAAAFGLPFSVNAQDPYQFFRDEYSRLQKLDPQSSDEKFYDKYGDSFYSFSQSLSKNNTGLQPTANAVYMSKYYKDLIDKVGPQYAGLIVGAEGDGQYSNGAYFYQKNTPASAGSNVTQRSTMSARDAWNQAQVSLGWRQYSSIMDGINAKLFDQGLKTYDDPGAEDLKAQRKGVVQMLSSQYLPNGKRNPYYNEAWDAEFNSLDTTKYDRTAFDLTKVVDDPEIWSKAYDAKTGTVGIRSDIFTLKTYLDQRTNMVKALAIRKMGGGSNDINAQSNYDLKNSFSAFTMALIEADTKFSSLHNRYFATDMGFDMGTTFTQSQQLSMQQQGATLVGSTDPEQDMMNALQEGANGNQ